MLAPAVIRAITKELQELHTSQEVRDLGIRVAINEADVTDISAELDGPPGTPYAGGTFRMRLALPADFPASPPKGWFTTPIWHPNVAKGGEICVNVLKRDWAPDLGLRHVLAVVRCLLIEPYPESALNEEASRALLEDYEGYARHAALMTRLHAAAAGGGGGAGQQQQQQPGASSAAAAAAAKRPHGPLTTSGANAAGAGSSGEGGGSGAQADASPLVKKARPELAKQASKVKKSLKRL